MPIHPKILSRLFANAVETRTDAAQAAQRLGRHVLLGHLPERVSADPALVTDSGGRIPNIRAMHQAGLFLDMVCWPLGTALPTIHIGRAPTNDLVVPDIRVSHQHVRLQVGDTVSVEDVGSSSGTTVNGETLAAHQPRVLKEHDVLALGGFELHVVGAVTLMEMLLNAGKSGTSTLQTPGPKSAT